MKSDSHAFIAKYQRDIKPSLDLYTPRIKQLIEDILRKELQSKDCPVAWVECRVKSVESLSAKIDLKGYHDPENEIMDFCGIRIVMYYADHVEDVHREIRKNLRVSDEHSVNKGAELKHNQFDYRSDHLVCQLNPSRAEATEWQDFGDRRFEIQVRSVLQHGWACIDHVLAYKNETDSNSKLRRRLNRLSALLELADDEFFTIKKCFDDLEDSYEEQINQQDYCLPLDLLSLSTYLDNDELQRNWAGLGQEFGLRALASLPKPHPKLIESLLATLKALKAGSLEEAVALLPGHDSEAARKAIDRLSKSAKRDKIDLAAIPTDVMHFALILTHAKKLPPDFKPKGPWRPNLKQLLGKLLPSGNRN